jgi:hypothetical protein
VNLLRSLDAITNFNGIVDNRAQQKLACALRARPPEVIELELFHAYVAVNLTVNGLPFVVDLTALLDGVGPTWRIKSMWIRRVRPEQAKQPLFPVTGGD